MSGRKTIPDKLKQIRGTDQPCRMKNQSQVDPISDINQISNASQLKILKTKRSKDIFKQKANQLLNLKVLTELDLEQLAVYANSLDMLFKSIQELKKGLYLEVHDENGHVLRFVENPYMKLYKEMVTITNKMAGDFGFTPISRTKFNIEKDPGENDLLKQFMV